jgi:hypothetical protein
MPATPALAFDASVIFSASSSHCPKSLPEVMQRRFQNELKYLQEEIYENDGILLLDASIDGFEVTASQ